MAASEDLALNKLMREQPEILEDALVNLCNQTKGKAKTYKHDHPNLRVVGGATARVKLVGLYSHGKELAWTSQLQEHAVQPTYRNSRGKRLAKFLIARDWVPASQRRASTLRPPARLCKRCPLAMSCALSGVIEF